MQRVNDNTNVIKMLHKCFDKTMQRGKTVLIVFSSTYIYFMQLKLRQLAKKSNKQRTNPD